MKKMFLTKNDLEDSLMIIEVYGEDVDGDEDLIMTVANNFARELFQEFDELDEDEKNDIIEMIIEDMPSELYSIN